MICLPGQEASVSNWYPVDATVLSALKRSCTSLIHLQNHERGADRQMSADTRRCIQVYQEWPRTVRLHFADPPYALKELETIPELIFQNNLLKEGGLLVLEHGKDNNFEENPHFFERRVYGSVNFSLFR